MLRMFCLLAVSFTACTTQNTQKVESEPKPLTLLREYLQVCREPQALVSWFEKNESESLKSFGPAAELVQDLGLHCDLLGGFNEFRVKESALDRAVGLAKSQLTGIWHRLAVILDASGKISRGSLRPTFSPEDTMPDSLDEAAVFREMNELVAKLTEWDLFSGIAVIAKGSEIVATAKGGYPDQKKRNTFTPDTAFTLGSMSKLFTSVAIGQLVDQGKLSYSDKVGRFFPAYGNQTVREKVTIAMLLSHQGGLGDFLEKRTPQMMKVGVNSAMEFVPLFENDPLDSAPGERFSYSNAGLALAGAIVEKVSGITYPQYVQQNILRAASMKNSDPNHRMHIGANLVVPYTMSRGMKIEAERDIGSPAGGGISTARDLVNFAVAFRNGKLVKEQTYQAITSPRSTTPMGSYGYAIQLDRWGKRRIVGHGGGFPGVSTELYMIEDTPYTLVILSNYDPGAAERVGGVIVPLLASLPLPSSH